MAEPYTDLAVKKLLSRRFVPANMKPEVIELGRLADEQRQNLRYFLQESPDNWLEGTRRKGFPKPGEKG